MSTSDYDQEMFARTNHELTATNFLNKDLQAICRHENLPVTGVKAALQVRIATRLKHLLDQREIDAFRALCHRISPRAPPPGYSYAAPSTNDYLGRGSSRYGAVAYKRNSYYPSPSNYPPSSSSSTLPTGSRPVSVKFADTPFHEIKEHLTSQAELPMVAQNRHTVCNNFQLGQRINQKLADDRSMRVLVYCTSDLDSPNPDIGFPSQIELKVNAETFQGNLRGIKKKVGTTRPADITSLVRRIPNYNNQLSITYAATERKYVCVVNLVKQNSVESLVLRVKQGNVILKESVINEMRSKANDADVVATSTVMSLKCPLSAMRLNVPCRSTICNHNQCFDAESFLQLQEQAPQWSCPICNKIFNFEALAVDQYVQDILRRFRSSDQVTIEPDGGVESVDGSEVKAPSSTTSLKRPAEDDDDIIEITDSRTRAIKTEPNYPPSPHSWATPSSYSCPPSTAASAAPTTNGRRKQPEVVDLTVSSDSDSEADLENNVFHDDYSLGNSEPPRRPFKGQSMGGSNSSFSDALGSLSTPGPRPPWAPFDSQPSGPPYSMPAPPAYPFGTLPQRPPRWPVSPSSPYGQFHQQSHR